MNSPEPRYEPEFYTIRVQGQLAADWSDWFADMTITYSAGDTILSGSVGDQAALHGLLGRIRDLNLTLISVVRQTSLKPAAEWTE